ncbi:hypothetical protein Tco_0992414 [Tanacetum coccineum]|uniref:Uncharacterized protein n=1 Tax=Tanacetum coccineum TaxID=301880 RepID=A0ABQ5F3C6_9ASTR
MAFIHYPSSTRSLPRLCLEELVSIVVGESEREYDISAVYGITYWWFRRKEFYINKHSESSNREAVRSQMRILKDYTIVPKPRAVVYRDRNDQRKLMRLNELHKYSDGTLTRVMEKLDQMVKDFHLYEYNKGMETRKWSEDDKRRSKDFITAIEKKPKIRRNYRSLDSFEPIQFLSFTHCGNKSILRVLRIIIVILPEHPSETIVFHNEDGNPARANIKQALGRWTCCDSIRINLVTTGKKRWRFKNGDEGWKFPVPEMSMHKLADPSQDDVRLCLGDDLKKAQDHSKRQASSCAPISSRAPLFSVAAGAEVATSEGIIGETSEDSGNHYGDAGEPTGDGGV